MKLFGSRGSNPQNGTPAESTTRDLGPPEDPIATQQALESGKLPPSALRRLELLSKERSFTSDLTINEFSLLKSISLDPICQVAGTAVYRIGYQPVPYGGSQPLSVLAQAFNESRRLATDRLQQEAHLAHADAVVGARITQAMFDAEAGLIEFSIIGTAVRSLGGPLDVLKNKTGSSAVLTTLKGQDLYSMAENGFVPLGLVGSSACYFASLSPYTFQQMYSMLGTNMVNFEIREFTEGYYASRHLVMREIERAAKAVNARGIIDFSFKTATNSYQVPGGEREAVGAVTFITHVLATAIAEIKDAPKTSQLKIMYLKP